MGLCGLLGINKGRLGLLEGSSVGGGSGAMVVQAGVMIYSMGWLSIIWLDESWCLVSVLGSFALAVLCR